jgi:hypothetical protein
MIRDRLPTDRVYIYKLCDLDGHIRYVGQSIRPDRRYKQHLHDATHSVLISAHDLWLKTCVDAKAPPIMGILQIVTASNADEYEAYWAYRYRAMGYNLVNDFSRFPVKFKSSYRKVKTLKNQLELWSAA